MASKHTGHPPDDRIFNPARPGADVDARRTGGMRRGNPDLDINQLPRREEEHPQEAPGGQEDVQREG
jgi:hypothetical protein